MRRKFIDDAELAEIERDLDELEALLRRPRRQRAVVAAAGGGALRSGRKMHDGLRPRPAAFARAIASGLKPTASAFVAGYRSPNRMTVWRLLRDEKVRAEIERLKAIADAKQSTGADHHGR